MTYELYVGEGSFPLDAEAWRDIRARLDQFMQAGPRQPPTPVMHAFHDAIVDALPEWGADEAGSGEQAWASAPLITEFSGDTALVPMTASAVDRAYHVVLRAALKLGLTVFDPTARRIYRTDANADLTMQVDGAPKIYWPRDRDISAGLNQLRSQDGPGFLILERENGSYAQIIGGPSGYLAEWRHDDEGHGHWAVGRDEQASSRLVSVRGNRSAQLVPANEKLKRADVMAVLAAFAAGDASPRGFAVRAITDQDVLPARWRVRGFLDWLGSLFGRRAKPS